MFISEEEYNKLLDVANYLDEIQAPQEFIDAIHNIKPMNLQKVGKQLLIPGHPIGKERPRVTTSHTFTPIRTREYEKLIKLISSPNFKKPIEGDLSISLQIYTFGRRADIDNIIKSILDGLQGIAFQNDSQVKRIEAEIHKVDKKQKEKVLINIYKIKQQQKIDKQIIELYHKILPELPKIRIWTESRQVQLKKRIEEDKERNNIKWWEDYFLLVRQCPFLMGEKEWKANLEWLIKKSNMAKVLNGFYIKNKKKTLMEKNIEVFEKIEGEGGF